MIFFPQSIVIFNENFPIFTVISNLAQQNKTSEFTVVRFALSLGYILKKRKEEQW